MSGITASRLALATVLTDAGIRVAFVPGLVHPPAVLVLATDPWVTPTHLVTASASLRWRVTAVAGKVDAKVTVEEVEDLVAAVVAAVANLPDGWSRIAFDSPGPADVDGAQYLVAHGRLDHVTEV